MKKLVNFAHPLSDEVKSQIEARIGEPVELVHIPAQFDLGRPLTPQIDDLIGGTLDAGLIIPPSLAAAATLLSDHFLPDSRPLVVWLKRGEGVPPKFELGGIE